MSFRRTGCGKCVKGGGEISYDENLLQKGKKS